MEIISLSMDEETNRRIDEIEKIGSYEGRSELVRKAIENLHKEIKAFEELDGEINAVLAVRHPQSHEKEIPKISHSFDEIINTQLHSKLSERKCLEVLHVEGKVEKIIEMYHRLEGSRSTDSVDLLPQV